MEVFIWKPSNFDKPYSIGQISYYRIRIMSHDVKQMQGLVHNFISIKS